MKKNLCFQAIALICVFVFTAYDAMAQNVGIHTTSPTHPFQVNADLISFDTLTDQSSNTFNSLLNIAPGQSAGQGIVAGMDGDLSQLSVTLFSGSGEITVAVHQGAIPGGPVLTQQTIMVDNTPGVYMVPFLSPLVPVEVGDGMCIVLTNLSADLMQWRKSNTNPYVSGQAYLYSDAWYPSPNDDLVFTTYITQTDTTDTPVFTVQENGRIGINDYTLPLHDGVAGQIMRTDGNGSVSWSPANQLQVDRIQDADGDTRIMTEKNQDEDMIRFDLKGVERMVLNTNADDIIRLELRDTSHNTFIGDGAGSQTVHTPGSSGHENTFVGHHTGHLNVNGSLNTGVGAYVLAHNLSGSYNTAIGWKSMYNNQSGSANTAVGMHALFQNNGGTSNTATGNYALAQNTNGYHLTATGNNALAGNTTGYENTATGSGALNSNTTGYWNSAFGRNALGGCSTGNSNTAAGAYALAASTTGSNNTAAGTKAMYGNWEGHNNVAIGADALRENHYGSNNTAVGYGALYTNTADNNTATGRNALRLNTTGYQNVATGIEALFGNTTGFRNTALGHSSHSISSNLQNSTGIGYNADCTASNQVRIGNASVTSIGGYANWTNVSDGRFKNNIAENVPGLDFITRLRPVTYHLDLRAIDDFYAERYAERDSSLTPDGMEKEEMVMTGFIAQEVEAAAQAIGYEFSGVDAPKNENDFYGLRYAEFVVPLVKAVQEQQAQMKDLETEINQLRAQNELLAQERAARENAISDLHQKLDLLMQHIQDTENTKESGSTAKRN